MKIIDTERCLLGKGRLHVQDDVQRLYPNIKEDIISSFCEQLICWIESLTPQSIEEDFALELLR